MSGKYSIQKYLNLDEYLLEKDISLSDVVNFLAKNGAKYISGSLVSGHGTIMSDIDAYGILDNISDIETVNHIYKNIRIDIGYISTTKVEDIIADINRIGLNYELMNVKNVGKSAGWSSTQVVEVFSRLVNSTFLADNLSSNIIDELNLDKYAMFASAHYWMFAENSLEDVIGFIKSEDLVACQLRLTHLTCFAIMSLLNKKKLFCDRSKWIPYYLNTNQIDLPFSFEEILIPSELSVSVLKSNMRKVDQLLGIIKAG